MQPIGITKKAQLRYQEVALFLI